MKILISSYTYYPSLDGVSHVTQYIAEGLAKKNWDVTVITSNHLKSKKNEVYKKVKIFRKNIFTKKTFYYGNKTEYINFLNSFSKKKFIFINVGLQNPFTDWALNYWDNTKFHKILYLHGIYSPSFNVNDFLNLNTFIKKIFRNLKWFYYLQFNKKYFKRYEFNIHLHKKDSSISYFKKIGIKKNLVLGNAVREEIFELKKINTERNIFISINSFNHRKNQILILRSFVKANIKNSLLILIGNNGKEYYNLLIDEKNKFKENNITNNIKILYNLSRKKTIQYLLKSNTFLMTSSWEAYPISIIEGLAIGIPFISFNVGILSNLRGGIIVNDEMEMIKMMKKICSDNNLRKKLSNEGKRYAKKNFQIEDKVNLLDFALRSKL